MNRKGPAAGQGQGGRPRGGGQRKDFHGGREFDNAHHGSSYTQYQRGGKKQWGPPHGHGNHGRGDNSSRDNAYPRDRAAKENSPASTNPGEIEQHARLLFVLANMIGTKVEVKVRNGTTYEGIYSASPTQKDLGVVLKMATRKTADGTEAEIVKTLIIMPKDVCSISARPLDFSLTQKTSGEREVLADTAISGHSGPIKERALQKWAPEGGADSGLGLDDEIGHSGDWDQFATNEKLFGVTTDFDEHIYTTALNKSDPDFKRREAEAIRLAREIERGPVNNVHVAEERGLEVNTADMDEEERYSSVIRQPGKYVPPGARKAAQTAATVKKDQPKDAKRNESPVNVPAKDSKKPGSEKATAAVQPSSVKSSVKEVAATHEQRRNTPSPQFVAGPGAEGKQVPLQKPTVINPVVAKLTQKRGVLSGGVSGTVPEGHAQQMAMEASRQFGDFSKNERAKIEKTRMRLGKGAILEDFKAFSNSIKLKGPMPEDLQKMLKKNKDSPQMSEAGLEGTNAGSTTAGTSKAATPEPKDQSGQSTPSVASSRPAKAETSDPKQKEKQETKQATKDKKAEDAPTTKPKSKLNAAAAEFTPSFTPVVPVVSPMIHQKSPQHGDKSPYMNKRMNKGQPYGGKQPYGKHFQKNNGSPKPVHYAPHYGEEMYQPGMDPQQFYPYPVPYGYARPMMAPRPFVPMPGMSMPPGPAAPFIQVAPGQFAPAPGFVQMGPHGPVYMPQFVPPANVGMRVDAGAQYRPDGQPGVSSPVPPAFMRSPQAIYPPGPMMPGYPPEMMPHFQPMMMAHPPGQAWAPDQMQPEMPEQESEQAVEAPAEGDPTDPTEVQVESEAEPQQ